MGMSKDMTVPTQIQHCYVIRMHHIFYMFYTGPSDTFQCFRAKNPSTLVMLRASRSRSTAFISPPTPWSDPPPFFRAADTPAISSIFQIQVM